MNGDEVVGIAATVLFGSGVALGVVSAVATFLWRRQGVTAGELFWAGSVAASHPERYVRSDRLTAIRVLNTAGAGFAALGVLIAVAYVIWPFL